MVVDASVWVSARVRQDLFHVVSRQWLDQRVQTGVPLTAPTLLVAEVAGAVSRRTGVAAIGYRAAQEIRSTPSVRLIWLDQTLATEAAHVAATMALRGADAVYVAVARRFDLPLVTWDWEVQTRCQGFVQVLQP